MDIQTTERDCKNCEFNKPYYDEDGTLLGTSCCKWTCVKDVPDMDCALRE